jgi:hypothetical protein
VQDTSFEEAQVEFNEQLLSTLGAALKVVVRQTNIQTEVIEVQGSLISALDRFTLLVSGILLLQVLLAICVCLLIIGIF